ncbi:hypothetical protein BBD39_10175 [Arsenophonus endosymbiont of Bemisia tabaci Asia II 3]|nr:hypothetical protein BBD39_10175 [Arsenophonus endosymbiont of Bemisia tabaci Asia II 3]
MSNKKFFFYLNKDVAGQRKVVEALESYRKKIPVIRDALMLYFGLRELDARLPSFLSTTIENDGNLDDARAVFDAFAKNTEKINVNEVVAWQKRTINHLDPDGKWSEWMPIKAEEYKNSLMYPQEHIQVRALQGKIYGEDSLQQGIVKSGIEENKEGKNEKLNPEI